MIEGDLWLSEEVRIDLEGMDFCEITRVHTHEPGDAGGECVGTEIKVNTSGTRIEVDACGKQPRKEMGFIFDIRSKSERETTTEVEGIIKVFDEEAFDRAKGRGADPFELEPWVLRRQGSRLHVSLQRSTGGRITR